MDIERRRYVLAEHRTMGDPPTWHWALPTARDVMDARRAATTGKGKDEAVDFMVLRNQIVARCLRRLSGQPVLRGGERLEVPATPDIEDRVRWVERLPMRWVTEVGQTIEAGGDLDDEEDERG